MSIDSKFPGGEPLLTLVLKNHWGRGSEHIQSDSLDDYEFKIPWLRGGEKFFTLALKNHS